MKRLCTICARAGSKGVKGKNIRYLLKKPLLVYSIEQAKRTNLFDYIAVSSDSNEILSIAEEWGVDFLIKRPIGLATDEAAKIPAIQHCVQQVEELVQQKYDIIVDLDVTSPLRNTEDIQNVVQILEEKQCSNVITGAPSRRSPYFNMVEVDKNGVVTLCKGHADTIVRRQDAPNCYDMNASIYGWQREALFKENSLFHHDTVLYIMPEERSVDIDSELDFRIVEYLLKEKRKANG